MSEHSAARAVRATGGTGSVGHVPDFVIIGAMRSGTTSLARHLAAHPDAFLPQEKELHFFDLHFDRGLQWYSERFRHAGAARAIGEATPSYMYEPTAVRRMASFLPGAKLIAILRNPIDRAYSHYWHNRARGRETLEFSDALKAESARLAQGDPTIRRWFSYIDRGRYLRQLLRVSESFPRGALLVFLFDDLRDRPTESYQAVCRFLEIRDEWEPENLGAPINAFTMFRSVRLRNGTRRLPTLLRDAIGRFNRRKGSYPPMEPRVREQLREVFGPENYALAKWLDRDLSAWK